MAWRSSGAGGSSGAGDALPGWQIFADEMLRQAVVRQGPVSDDIAARALALPSLRADGNAGVAAGEMSARALAGARTAAWEALRLDIAGTGPFAAIVASAGLDEHEAALVAVLGAVEIDPQRRRVVTGLGGRADGTVTLAALAAALPGSLTAAAPDARLDRCSFVEVGTSGAWGAREVSLAASLVWQLLGSDRPDPQLPERFRWFVHRRTDAVSSDCGVVLVAGPDQVVRRRRALSHLGAAGALVIDAVRPPAIEGVVAEETAAIDWRAVVREATRRQAAVLVELDGHLPAAVRRWVERADHLRWGLLSATQLPLDQLPARPWLDDQSIERVAPAAEVRQQMGGALGAGHRLTHTQLEQIRGALPALGGDPRHAARRLVTGELDRLTTRVRPTRTWDDLVLPETEFTRVKMVAARYRHRDVVMDDWGFRPIPSAGVVALFSGPPGTGKTMSAEVIANDLGLDMFKVNLATMVSKYIGETEKNLEQLFDVADTGNVMLLFDEADSMFGKRSEVNDSHDRYANLEVSYLLQRIERFDGLVVLTTNLSSNIDQAFMRRIHVVIDFPAPDEDERRRLWIRSFPADAPQGDIDLDYCVRFRLTGADIRAVSLGAAFRAADEGRPIEMRDIVGALVEEQRKQGRLVEPSLFAPYDAFVPQIASTRRNG